MVDDVQDLAPEVVEELPAPIPDDLENLAPEVIEDLPDPAIPEPEDIPSITSQVPTVPGQIVEDVTSAVDVPSVAAPPGIGMGG